ncbi:MAG: RMD1 family protein [Candidatus Giovannonibacteria bacterium]|nr:RMD1 family protein [Candidatus Giovannonibacteria bacterium]
MQDYKEYNLEAIYLAKEINLAKAADKLDKNLIGRRREFLTYLLGPREFLFIFSFGAVVFANIAKDTQFSIKKSLNKFLTSPAKPGYDDNYVLRETEHKFNVMEESADLPVVGIGEVEIAARILAQSVALEYIEDITDGILANLESMNVGLEKGRFSKNTKEILQLVAQNNNIIQFVITKLSLLDKPDVTWGNERLETLFSQLADIFDLRPRFRNIEYKIGFARSNSEFALTALQSQRANFLEVIIIVLIVIDILIYFLGK